MTAQRTTVGSVTEPHCSKSPETAGHSNDSIFGSVCLEANVLETRLLKVKHHKELFKSLTNWLGQAFEYTSKVH